MPIRFRQVAVAALTWSLAACGGNSNPYAGMNAEALFGLASQEYEEGDYDNAIAALDRLLLSFGDWDRVPQARLLLGHAHYGAGEYLTARAEYVRSLDRYSGNAAAPVAALGVCRSLAALSPEVQRDQSYTNDAIIVCRNVVVDYAGTPQAGEAAALANEMRQKMALKEYETGYFYCRRKLWDSALKYYEFTANLYSETALAPRALAGIYYANVQIGYEDEAEAAKNRLLQTYPDSAEAKAIQAGGIGSC